MSWGIIRNLDGYALKAENLSVGQDMYCECLKADGEVRLEGSHIGGSLNFNGATLRAQRRKLALAADRITVGQDMYCGMGFHARGQTSLAAANISRNLNFGPATLESRSGIALAADALTVRQAMYC